MLSPETTAQLIVQAQEGDEQAKNTLISENMPLIISVVKRFRGRQVEYDDLIQLGSLGLLKAIMNFDASFNVRFSTYAVPMIAGEIKRYIRDDGSIKVSRALKSTAAKIAKYVQEFAEENKREPTVDEIALKLEMSPEDIVFAMDSSKGMLSLYEKSEEDSLSLIDKLSDNGSEEIFDKVLINQIIDKLPEREKKLIILRYFRDKTQSEIAVELGVSQVQVSRLENKILEKLKAEIDE